MKRIAFVIPYFGKLPAMFPAWLNSCQQNPTIDFIVFTDDKTTYNYPDNVKVEYTTFDKVKKQISDLFDFENSLDTPYKLCDYKPTYGLVFAKWLKDYDFWGLIATFSDIMKGRYNYDKEMNDAFSEPNTEKYKCNDEDSVDNCIIDGIIKGPKYYTDKSGQQQKCLRLYSFSERKDFKNYDKSARILAVLILSLFTSLCYCGLAFSGFMLFKEAPK